MKANHFTTEEIRSSWQSIKGARIANGVVNTGNGTAVLGAEYISIPDWVVVTDDPYANLFKKVWLH